LRVLVTGSQGRLGTALGPPLEAAGLTVTGLDLPALDITRREAAFRALEDHRPDVVIQCAAFTDVDGAEARPAEARAVNVDGTRNVAQACARTGAWLLQLSTDFVFGGEGRRPHREDDPPDPRGVYARTKWEGEGAVAQACPSALVVRTAWLYGGRGADFVAWVLDAARAGLPLRVVRDQVGSPTLVGDLAVALTRLATLRPRPSGLLHVANAGCCSRLELARAALRAAGVEAAVEGIPTSALPPGAPRPAYSALDCGRFRRLTGSALRPWEEALEAHLADPGARTAEEREIPLTGPDRME